jgi:hypothetical protein
LIHLSAFEFISVDLDTEEWLLGMIEVRIKGWVYERKGWRNASELDGDFIGIGTRPKKISKSPAYFYLFPVFHSILVFYLCQIFDNDLGPL